jgi:predicted nucleic-acid-binding Zn-ribbon protein
MGQTVTTCPHCGRDPQAIQVNGSTVTDIIDTEHIRYISVRSFTCKKKERGAGLEQLETRQRAEGMESIYQAHPAGAVARRRRQTHQAGRIPGRG